MISELCQRFESHLSEYEADSQDWGDGLGYDISAQLLREFQTEDWAYISQIWATKEKHWRECFISSLDPSLGTTADYLLISALDDPDIDVAFDALREITFYCGINADKNGPFLDKSILNLSFRERVRGTDNIIEKIKYINAHCDSIFQASHNLLLKELM